MIELGDKVTDSITGFSGVAISRIEYLTGCTQIGIAPKVGDDGKLPDIIYFDESRLDGTNLQNKDEIDIKGGPSISIPNRAHP